MQKICLGSIFDNFDLGPSRNQNTLSSLPFNVWEDEETLWAEFYRNDTGYLFRMIGIADFYISYDGKECTCYPIPGLENETRDHMFRSQVQPFLWNRRNKLIFHASCIDYDDTAIAFMGESGKGKSTLVAAFAKKGCGFLTDDGLLIEKSKGEFWAKPNDPSIRLWDTSYEALMTHNDKLSAAISFTDKKRILASSLLPYCNQPRPLKAVYFLANDDVDDFIIKEVKGARRHVLWSKCSFNLDVWDKEAMSLSFENVAELAMTVPSFTLDYPRDFDKLDSVIESLEVHINAHMGKR